LILSSAVAIEYQNEDQFEYIDPRFFMGLEGGYSYTVADEMDKLNYGYGIYAGMPISDFEIIVKHKEFSSDNYDASSNAIIINKQIDGTGARNLYLGFVVGETKLTFNDNTVSEKALLKKEQSENYYGVHLGKRYKFSREMYVRIELEYQRFGYTLQSTTKDLNIDSAVEFIYGLEYRF
jgi:hypothetical protein